LTPIFSLGGPGAAKFFIHGGLPSPRQCAKICLPIPYGGPRKGHASATTPKFDPNFLENLSSEISLIFRTSRGSDSPTNNIFIENSDEPFEVTKLGNENGFWCLTGSDPQTRKKMVDSAGGLVKTVGGRRTAKKFSALRPPFSRYLGSKFDTLTSFPDKPEVETVTPAKHGWGVQRATIPENFANFRRRVPELFEFKV